MAKQSVQLMDAVMGQQVGVAAGALRASNAATAGTPSAAIAGPTDAGVRHVVTAISIGIAAAATAQPAVQVTLKSGATTVMQWALAAPVNSGQEIDLHDIFLPPEADGDTWTLAFSGACAAGVVGYVNLTAVPVVSK